MRRDRLGGLNELDQAIHILADYKTKKMRAQAKIEAEKVKKTD